MIKNISLVERRTKKNKPQNPCITKGDVSNAVLLSDMTKFAGIVPDATAASTTIVQICWILRNRSGANIGGASDV